jgi:hypothetical protein
MIALAIGCLSRVASLRFFTKVRERKMVCRLDHPDARLCAPPRALTQSPSKAPFAGLYFLAAVISRLVCRVRIRNVEVLCERRDLRLHAPLSNATGNIL